MSTPFQSLNIFLEIMLPSKYEFNEKTFKETFSQQQNDFPQEPEISSFKILTVVLSKYFQFFRSKKLS